MQDVVIVGAGPSGCKCARMLSKSHDVTVLEEHSVSGTPIQCTGLISPIAAELSGVEPEILNKLYGAVFRLPSERTITIRTKKPKAFLIDRADFDRKMAYSAIDAGARIMYGTKYHSHVNNDGSVAVDTYGNVENVRLLIGADGHSSKVAASIENNRPSEYLRGIQYDVKYEMEVPDLAEISIGNKIAPGFFAWKIPFGDFTRVGLCTSWDKGAPFEYFKSFLKKEKMEDCKVISKMSGKIPLGTLKRTYSDNIMLVGDAACQVKPLSGGGLYPAMVACDCLVQTAESAFRNNNFSSKFLSSYEKMWKEKVGKILERDYRIRNYYTKLKDEEFEKIYDKVGNEDHKEIYENTDIDDTGTAVGDILSDIPLALSSIPLILKVRFRR